MSVASELNSDQPRKQRHCSLISTSRPTPSSSRRARSWKHYKSSLMSACTPSNTSFPSSKATSPSKLRPGTSLKSSMTRSPRSLRPWSTRKRSIRRTMRSTTRWRPRCAKTSRDSRNLTKNSWTRSKFWWVNKRKTIWRNFPPTKMNLQNSAIWATNHQLSKTNSPRSRLTALKAAEITTQVW